MIEHDRAEGAYVLDYAGVRLPFRIQFRARKKLAITVYPDQRLEILAPEGRGVDEVLTRVVRRRGWILKQWRYFEQFKPKLPPRDYVSGESCLYLGRQYRLKINEDQPELVKLEGRYLHVWTRDTSDRERIRHLVTAWYRSRAERLFCSRLRMWLEKSPSLRLDEVPKLSIRQMTNRWASCTKAGNVLLNPDLVKAPIHCVDYVIVHELCHCHVHDHGAAFYRLLARCLPDWEKRKARLADFCV